MRIRGLLVLSVMAFAATGCSSIEPWVKPYDRENLADPIMVFTRAPSRRTSSTTCSNRAKARAAPPVAVAAVAAAIKREPWLTSSTSVLRHAS